MSRCAACNGVIDELWASYSVDAEGVRYHFPNCRPERLAAENARLRGERDELLEALKDGLGWDSVEPRWRREAEALIARIEGGK